MPNSIGAELIEAWYGELYGQAVSNRLREVLADAALHHKELDQMECIEALMAEALRPLLPADLDEPSACQQARAKAARLTGALDWDKFLQGLGRAVDEALPHYRSLEALASTKELPVVRLLVQHAEAFDEFVRKASSAPSEAFSALSAMVARLRSHLAAGAPVH